MDVTKEGKVTYDEIFGRSICEQASSERRVQFDVAHFDISLSAVASVLSEGFSSTDLKWICPAVLFQKKCAIGSTAVFCLTLMLKLRKPTKHEKGFNM